MTESNDEHWAATTPRASRHATETTAGRSVGKYRLRQLLGRGGMGEVYLGEHELLGRTAAVKLLSPRLTGNKEALARFFREAVATSQIKHPGIAHIYDYGQEDGGPAFIVMELLDGETLRARIDRLRQLSVCRAAALGSQIAGVLAAAHNRGIIHRDLKPANIFVVADSDVPGGERAKVLDFGIAKLSENDESSAELTASGAILGTPVFMSPEQCRSRRDVDASSDVYTLGCVLYRLVAGRPPFDFDSIGELIVAHCTREPAPLPNSVAAPRRFELLLRRMLAKDPEERPRADAVRAELEAVVAAGPISSPPSVPPRSFEDATTAIAALSSRATSVSGSHSVTEVEPATRIGGQTALGTVPGTDAHELARPGVFTRGLANQPVRLDHRYARTVGVGEASTAQDRRSIATIAVAAVAALVLVFLVVVVARSGDAPSWDGGEGRTAKPVQAHETPAQRAAVEFEPAALEPATKPTGAEPTETKPAAAKPTEAIAPAAIVAQEPAQVAIEIRSKPSGARVRLAPRGRSIGTTPLVVHRDPTSLPLAVWLSRRGYQTRKVLLVPAGVATQVLKRKRRPPPDESDPLARP